MPAKNVISGANVGFKVGTQETVDRILAGETGYKAIHGCFYLTQDSHRLYVGNEDETLSPVNEGIEFISSMSALQQIASSAASSTHNMKHLTGRFYYVGQENVLCVYNGQNWVQINNNSNTTILDVTDSVTAASNTATVTTAIRDTIDGTNANDTFSDAFTITGANGITVTGTGKAITLTGDTYTLSSADITGVQNQVNIHLESTNTNNDSNVKLAGGEGVEISQANNTITIAAPHITNASANISSDAAGFTVTVTDSEGDHVDASVDPKVAWYTDSNPSGTTTNSVSFANGTATLDVYSRGAVDAKMQAINAMTYKGAITSSQISYNDTTGVTTITVGGQAITPSIGDTYLISTDGTYNGITYQEGSLIIIKAKSGVSETNGVLPANGYDCDIVKEKYIQDTRYYLNAITKGVELKATTNDDVVGSIVVDSGDNYINVAETTTANSADPQDGYNKTLTVTHKDVTRTNTNSATVTQGNGSSGTGAIASVTIPVVTAVTSDAKGHVTGVTSGSYVLTDTNASLTSVTSTTSAYSNSSYSAGVVNTQVTLTQSDGTPQTQSDAFIVRSSTLSITNNDSTPTTSGGSTTQEGIQVELVWGSF